MSELKPCPFCGGSAHTEYLNERHPDLYTVRCDNNGCFANKMGFGWKVGLEDMIAAWNTRVSPEREALEKIRDLACSGTIPTDEFIDGQLSYIRAEDMLKTARNRWRMVRDCAAIATAALGGSDETT